MGKLLHSVRETCLEDAFDIAKRLRAADRMEIEALYGDEHDPLSSLLYGIGCGVSRAVVFEKRPVALFGAAPHFLREGNDTGLVWLLGTDDISMFARSFLRDTKPWVEWLHTHYPRLTNVVDERNTVHIRWLEWAGFEITQRHEEFGVAKLPFLEFVREV